jgi:hypothetical protein
MLVRDKIQDFHSHFNSFLEPQQVKNISELFNNNNLLSNCQSLFTCQVACESEHINFALHNRGRRQHSLLQSGQFKLSPCFHSSFSSSETIEEKHIDGPAEMACRHSN